MRGTSAKKQVAPGESRHFVIGYQEIGALLGKCDPSGFTILGGVDVVTVGTQDLPENVANPLIVVDNENAPRRRRGRAKRTVAGLRGRNFLNGIVIVQCGFALNAMIKRIFG